MLSQKFLFLAQRFQMQNWYENSKEQNYSNITNDLKVAVHGNISILFSLRKNHQMVSFEKDLIEANIKYYYLEGNYKNDRFNKKNEY